MQTNFSMITKIKNLKHESCVKQCGEATRKENFKWQTVCDEFEKIPSKHFQT
jgi:hypothetical protein